MTEKNVRAHVVISGKVQGVCFRAETQRIALKCHVKGWVRNRSDGTVEAVFEGEECSVEAVLEWCERSGPPRSHVDHVEILRQEYTGEFSSFEITW